MINPVTAIKDYLKNRRTAKGTQAQDPTTVKTIPTVLTVNVKEPDRFPPLLKLTEYIRNRFQPITDYVKDTIAKSFTGDWTKFFHDVATEVYNRWNETRITACGAMRDLREVLTAEMDQFDSSKVEEDYKTRIEKANGTLRDRFRSAYKTNYDSQADKEQVEADLNKEKAELKDKLRLQTISMAGSEDAVIKPVHYGRVYLTAIAVLVIALVIEGIGGMAIFEHAGDRTSALFLSLPRSLCSS